MKKARIILSILALSFAAGACASSITAPQDCYIIPGPNTYTCE